jgi:hypothetical protein
MYSNVYAIFLQRAALFSLCACDTKVPEDVKQALIARKRKELSLDSCDKSVTSEGAHVPKVK